MTPARTPADAAADPWKDVSAARLPAADLPALAPLRADAGVRVYPAGDTVWVRWPAGRPAVVRCLLPVPGVEFFTSRDGRWFRFGSRLPTADAPPNGDGQSVAAVVVPARFEPIPPDSREWPPVGLRIVRGGGPRPATTLACRTTALSHWADTATTAELSAVRAAWAGGRTVLLGSRLPTVPAATRFWGNDLLVPVGFRVEPELPAATVRAAVGAATDEVVLLDESGVDVIPRAAFAPVTRAGLRLAVRELLAGGESP